MKVLLCQSPIGRSDEPVFPHGICCIATVLKQQHDVHIFDPNITCNYSTYVQKLITSFQPDIIGVSLRNIDTTRIDDPWFYYLAFKKFLSEIRGLVKDVPIVAGGAAFSIFPRELMILCREIDFGVYLEGEEIVPELLDNLNNPSGVKGVFYRKDGEIVFTGNRKLPDAIRLPIIDRSLFDLGKYTTFPFSIGVETKRGCNLNCAYCCYPYLNGRRVRLRKPEQVVDEIEELIVKYKLTSFSFIDSVIDVPKGHFLAICREIIDRKLKIDWSGWYSGREFDERMFFIASQAGCKYFSFSPDGYTPRALNGLQKYIRHEDLHRIIKIFRKNVNGTKVSFNFFINSPEIGLVDFLKTLSFCIKAKIILRKCLGGIGTDYIRILPFTALYKISMRKGVITRKTNLLPGNKKDFKKVFYHEPGTRIVDFLFKGFQLIKGMVKKVFGIKKIVADQASIKRSSQ